MMTRPHPSALGPSSIRDRGCPGTLWALLGLSVLFMTSSPGALSFLFDYGTSNEGFNDPTLGETRRSALEDAAATVGSWFDHYATVQIQAQSFDDPNDQTLAFAGSAFAVVSGYRGYLPGIVSEKILSNGTIDSNGINADGQLTVNFGHTWEFGDQVDPSSYDFKATVMHEMLHAIGFASGVNADGTDIWGPETLSESTPGGGTNGGIWSPYDDHLVDVSGTSIIDDGDYSLNLMSWVTHSNGGAAPGGGLFFDGEHATAANGGQAVPLYTPSEFLPGSSVSHLDSEYPGFENLLMSHSTAKGAMPRSLSAIEQGVLQDLGYKLIPEPSTALLLLWSSLLFFHRRRPKEGTRAS